MTKITINKLSEYKYQLYLFKENNVFLESVFALLGNSGASITKSATNNYSISLDFCAHSVKPLSYYQERGLIDYHLAISMMHSLYKQQSILEKYNCGFYCLDMDDIIVIDSSIFICINPSLIKDIRDKHFTFYSPFSRASKHGFFSPEIMELNFIPASIHLNCFYYSLGALAVYCLFGKKIDKASVSDLLKPIAQTKLYWMLLKSLSIDCERRTLIYF